MLLKARACVRACPLVCVFRKMRSSLRKMSYLQTPPTSDQILHLIRLPLRPFTLKPWKRLQPDCNRLLRLLRLSASLEPKICLISFFYLLLKCILGTGGRCVPLPCSLYSSLVLVPAPWIHFISCIQRAAEHLWQGINQSLPRHRFFRLRRGPAIEKVTQVGPSPPDWRQASVTGGRYRQLSGCCGSGTMNGWKWESIPPPDSHQPGRRGAGRLRTLAQLFPLRAYRNCTIWGWGGSVLKIWWSKKWDGDIN